MHHLLFQQLAAFAHHLRIQDKVGTTQHHLFLVRVASVPHHRHQFFIRTQPIIHLEHTVTLYFLQFGHHQHIIIMIFITVIIIIITIMDAIEDYEESAFSIKLAYCLFT